MDHRVFKAEDIKELEIRDQAMFDFGSYEPEEWARHLVRIPGVMWTVYDSIQIRWACGISVIWEGIGLAWIVCDRSVVGMVRELVPYTKKLLDEAVKGLRLHRVEGHVRADWRGALSFAKRLGFKEVARLTNYQTGLEYVMLARS